ncbi:dihydropteroate synthase [Pelagibacterales bacterium SAG-MED13]|nr:dihydropteroate synthase [Pelagibacterales bacterium SAG-MED13]
MPRYYTKVCNFYYGYQSRLLIEEKKTLPLNGSKEISFDEIEIISRNSKKRISIKKINKLPYSIKKIVKNDIKIITSKKKKFQNLSFENIPNIMGVLNTTPDSFSDGGKYNKIKLAKKRLDYLFKCGADLVDIGGESTRPGSKTLSSKIEWNRLKDILKKIDKKKVISLDTRKSDIMEKGINLGISLINDVSGLNYDNNSINILKKYKIPFVLQHSLGNPDKMQNNPKYKNVLLDIYDFFEEKIKFLRKVGIKHNNIILDPGIGFGKNLKHNITIIRNISIYHSLGLPILLGISRKRFIKELSGINDSYFRIGGTISSGIYAMKQGVQILRVHDVNEINQSIKVFKELIK